MHCFAICLSFFSKPKERDSADILYPNSLYGNDYMPVRLSCRNIESACSSGVYVLSLFPLFSDISENRSHACVGSCDGGCLFYKERFGRRADIDMEMHLGNDKRTSDNRIWCGSFSGSLYGLSSGLF